MAILSSIYDVESNIETTIYSSISPTATTGIVLNAALTIAKGVLSFETNGQIEYISFGGASVSDGKTTLSDVRRNLTTTLNDFSQISATGLQHVAGITIVKLINYHALYNLKAGTGQANVFTANQTLSGETKLFFNNSDTWIYDDGTDLKFRSSGQSEISLAALAGASGVNDKTKISFSDSTEGYLDTKLQAFTGLKKTIGAPGGEETLDLEIDLTDTNVFSETPAAGKVPLFDSDGALTSNKLVSTQTADEPLSKNEAVVLNYKGNVVKSNSGAVDTTFPFLGITQEPAFSAGDAVNIATPGAVIEMPALPLSDYVNGVLRESTMSNNISNTSTDYLQLAAQWRAQTFTASANPWENNIGSVVLNLNLIGTIGGSLTVGIFATEGGLPIGSPLATKTHVYTSVTNGLNEFLFTEPVEITPGEVYAIVLAPGPGVSGENYMSWYFKNTDVYAGGQSAKSSDSGVSWVAEPSFDRYFVIKYYSIQGAPVFIGEPSGALTLKRNELASNKYNQRVGYVVDRTHFSLERGQKSICAQYTFSFSANQTVYTEITIGFKPHLVFATLFLGFYSWPSGPEGSIGFWMAGGGASRINGTGTLNLASSGVANFSQVGENLGFVTTEKITSDVQYACIFLGVPSSSSSNSITIRRDCTNTFSPGSTVNGRVILNIIGF